MASILQLLKVVKRRLFEKVSLERWKGCMNEQKRNDKEKEEEITEWQTEWRTDRPTEWMKSHW